MARPAKLNVEYFPHDSNAANGKTLFILENQFGNDGYAFWFKLLEIVSASENLVYATETPASWQFLLAKTRVSDETARKILDVLCDLDAIDQSLYRDHGLIWSDNLLERVRDAFRKRTTVMPEKPVSAEKTPVSAEKTTVSAPKTRERERETKGKLKGNNILPEFIDEKLWDAFLDMRQKIRKPPTDNAKSLLIKDLVKFKAAGDNPNEVLERSIKSSWAGLFPLDRRGGNNGQAPVKRRWAPGDPD